MHQKTVGQILRQERIKRHLEYKDIQAQIKILPSYLEALELGRYEEFSSILHLKSFLKVYARYLGLNEDEIMAFFRREYETRSENTGTKKIKPINNKNFYITPTFLIASVTTLAILGFFSFIYFQYQQYSKAPLLIIENPLDDVTFSKGSSFNIKGKTDPDARVKVNGQQISSSVDGSFSTFITLAKGTHVLVIESINSLEKVSKVSKTITIEEIEATEEPQIGPTLEGLVLIVNIGPGASWVEVEADGTNKFKGLLGAGVEKKFNAARGFRVIAGNAGSVSLSLNGEPTKVMGSQGETLEKIIGDDLSKPNVDISSEPKSDILEGTEKVEAIEGSVTQQPQETQEEENSEE